MDVRNCRSCGKIFNYIGGQPICQTCKNKLEDKFQEVKAYINEHPHAQIYEVSEETEVSISQIRHWIREERLTFSPESTVGIECESCGKIIKTGRFCDRCKESLVNTLNGVYPTQVKKDLDGTKPKMRYFGKNR